MNLLSTNKAALLAGLGPDSMRYHARKGHLVTITIDRGHGRIERLFVQEDVERFLRDRATRTEARLARKAS